MHSFRQMLLKWLEQVKPTRIVEWGPGLSTRLMLEQCPTARIMSIEHNPPWFIKAQAMKTPNLDLVLQDATARGSAYATHAYTFGEEIDFAFVDGRRRVECALVALSMLREGGVVMLHDWCRKTEYRLVLEYYARTLESKDNTVVLVPRLKRARPIPPPAKP